MTDNYLLITIKKFISIKHIITLIRVNKFDCESLGGEWVNEYRKKDGTLVRSYCRQPGDSATNYGDEVEKKKEFEVNQQVILNRLLESTKTFDFDDAQTVTNFKYLSSFFQTWSL